MNYKDIIYSFACLSFITMIGGGVYEHLAVIPKWSAAPPASLTMFQGEHGLNPAVFWSVIHPVTVLLLLISLALNWKSVRRKFILWPLISYIIALIATASYYVPELIDIITTTYADEVDTSLRNRAALWEDLSIIRIAVLIGFAIMLLLGLSRSETHNAHN